MNSHCPSDPRAVDTAIQLILCIRFWGTSHTKNASSPGSMPSPTCNASTKVKIIAPKHIYCIAYQRQFAIYTFNFPAGSLPNIGVSHHLEMNGKWGTSKHPLQGWHTFWLQSSLHLVVPFLYLGVWRLSDLPMQLAHVLPSARIELCPPAHKASKKLSGFKRYIDITNRIPRPCNNGLFL